MASLSNASLIKALVSEFMVLPLMDCVGFPGALSLKLMILVYHGTLMTLIWLIADDFFGH